MTTKNSKAKPARDAASLGRAAPAGERPRPAYAGPAAATAWWARPGVVVAFVVLGLGVRLLISANSWGTSDVATFMRFGIQVENRGLLDAYRHDRDLNHPPIPIVYDWVVYRLTDDATYAFVFKLPVIAFEAVTAWLLWRRWRGGRADDGPLAPADARRAAGAAIGYSLSLCAILVSGYHCNTDTLYGALCLLSAWLLEARGRPLAAGLALAAAINVKLIPVLLIPGLLLSLRTRRDAAWFLGGLSVGVLPFVPVLIAVGPSFYQNALAYASNLDKWGVPFLLLPNDDLPNYDHMWAAVAYHRYAKYPLLALLVAWAVVARRLGRWDRYEVAAVTLGLFLVFAPGFGIQYTAIPIPLMFAVRPGIAAVYSLVAGAFLAVVYGMTLVDSYPLYSEFRSLFPHPSPWVGAAAWALLVYFTAAVLLRPRSSAADGAGGGRPAA